MASPRTPKPPDGQSETSSLRAGDVRRIQLRSRRLVAGDLLGAYRSASKGSGLVYSDLREYQPGDDVKHIHWKATARTDHVVVKSYDEERQLRVLVAVDCSSSIASPLHSPLHARAVEFTSLIAALTQRGNDLLGACLFSDKVDSFVPPSSAPGRHQKILSLLRPGIDEVSRQSTDLGVVLSSLQQLLRRPTLTFILSDYLCRPFDADLRKLASRHDVVLVHLEQEVTALPKAGMVTFTDSETGRTMTVDTSSPHVRRIWREQIAHRRSAMNCVAQECGVDVIHITDSVAIPLAELMATRNRKRAQIRRVTR